MENLLVLLPVYNRINTTEKCISCIKAQNYTNYTLVLIDDGSTDGTADMVLREIPDTVVIKGKGNWWWAGSLQQGINWINHHKFSSDDFILILNDDVEFADNFFDIAISILKSKRNTLLLSQCFSKQTGELIDAGTHVDWNNLSFVKAESPEHINCLSTRGLFFRIEDMQKIGSFHPFLLPHYGSDYEYTIRAYNKGFKLITDEKLKLYCDDEKTGIHNIKGENFFIKMKKLFSKKSALNPFMWLIFIAFSCPAKNKIKAIFNGGVRLLKKVI